MSELKGMKIYMAVDPQEDGTFFIKKSTIDGSLAVFDEERKAVLQVKRNADNTEFREGFIVRTETKENIESEIDRLTAIATKHATRADELYEALEKIMPAVKQYLEYEHDGDPWTEDARSMGEMELNELDKEGVIDEILSILDKSRIEAEGL